MNILVYFPYNLRTVEQQSVMEMLVHHGHRVILLTTCARGYLHDYVQRFGVIALAAPAGPPNPFIFYLSTLRQLSSVINDHHVDLVIAQQQIPALIAGSLRIFQHFKLVYVRHNSDEGYSDHPYKAWWLNRIVNRLTPLKVAPSSAVYRFWIEKEKVSPNQICRINYGYNFQQYEHPVKSHVESIRERYAAKLLILSIARLVPTKRHKQMLLVVARLISQGCDVKLLCLGSGPLQEELTRQVQALRMQDRIFFLGTRDALLDYIAAADVLLHLSASEASNSAVKEAALCRKPVIVCRGIGDFEDYIVHRQNGFLVSRDDPSEEAYEILRNLHDRAIDGSVAGDALYRTVTRAFDIHAVASEYDRIIHQAT